MLYDVTLLFISLLLDCRNEIPAPKPIANLSTTKYPMFGKIENVVELFLSVLLGRFCFEEEKLLVPPTSQLLFVIWLLALKQNKPINIVKNKCFTFDKFYELNLGK